MAEAGWVFEMKYDIYFHGGCFDGAASVATLLYFLRLRGDSYGKFIPLTHPVNKNWWKKLKMKNPSAIVDITHHPLAAIWFDHHPTTFIDKKWEKNFKPDLWHQLNTKSPSCTSLIYRHLTKNFKIRPPKYITELARWLDITDAAGFKNVKEALSLKPPAMQIAKSFVDLKPPASYAKSVILALSESPLAKVAKLKEVRKRFLKHKNGIKKSWPEIKKRLVLKDKVAILYGMSKRLTAARFAPYYFYPESKYSVRILKRGKFFVLSVGINPWNRPKNQAHIGRYLEKSFSNAVSAGGHSVAGAAAFKTKKEALEAVSKIADYLNNHV